MPSTARVGESGQRFRRVAVLVLSVGALLALFGAYSVLMRPIGGAGLSDTADALPTDARFDQPAGQPVADLRVASGRVLPSGGGALEFTIYDEQTGRPRETFRCKSYMPVPGVRDEILVTQPELTLRLPSGMTAQISAAEGQVSIDREGGSSVRPRAGRMEGAARIVIDRGTALDRPPLAERPADRIELTLRKMEFDLERGRLFSDDEIQARSTDLVFDGWGLKLVWNQADNRVETLRIERGDRFELLLGGGGRAALLGGASSDGAGANAAGPRSNVASASTRPAARGGARRGSSGYRCLLTGEVEVEQWRDDVRVGGLKADELELGFGVGGGGGAAESGPSETPATSRPSVASAPSGYVPQERLVVRWCGPLVLTPSDGAAGAESSRRRVEARGAAVVVDLPDEGRIVCGGLILHDDSQRLWLAPGPGGLVDIDMPQRLSGTAQSVFFDGRTGLLKLVGPVKMRSAARRAAPGAGRAESDLLRRGRRLTVACEESAELTLARAETSATSVDALAAGAIQSASFRGAARVDLGGDQLTAERVVADFDADAGSAAAADDQLAGRLRLVSAQGQARLESERRRLEAGWLTLRFARDGRGAAFAERLEAHGDVRLADDGRRVVAAGRELRAALAPGEQLERATIVGTSERFATAAAQGYRVRGQTIELSGGDNALRVAGPSELRFNAQRTLQGRDQSRPVETTVTSRDSLAIDLGGQPATVTFIGEVNARGGDEQLTADALTLFLEPAPPRAAPTDSHGEPAAAARWLGALTLGEPLVMLAGGAASGWRELEQAWSPADATRRPASPAASGVVRDPGPQEPRRAVARNALVESNTMTPGDSQPLVHQSIAAPELEIDVPQRTIRTVGQTRLQMIDRRLDANAMPQAGGGGLTSALMSRGPSQTLLQCARQMTYAIGPEGPARSDRVVFEGGVRFVHVAGREMINLEQMLPQVRDNPGLLEKLPSRSTQLECDRLDVEFVAAQPGATPAGAAPAVPAPSGSRAPVQLGWLAATGSVYLRDQLGPVIRTMEAAQLEFDRAQGIVRVIGGEGADARVWNENKVTHQLDAPAVAPEIILDVQNNTIRATRSIRGTIRGR